MDIALLGQIPALLVLVVAAASVRWLSPWTHSWVIETLLLLAVSLMLPWIAGLVMIAGLLLARHGLVAANRLKIAMNGMPITWNDITITARQPAVLFHIFALNSRIWLPLAGLVLLGIAIALIYGIYAAAAGTSLQGIVAIVFNLGIAAVISAGFRRKLLRTVSERIYTADYLFGKDVRGSDGGPIELWDPQAFVQLSYHLGPIGFLLYTQRLNNRFAMPILDPGAANGSIQIPPVDTLEAPYVKRAAVAQRLAANPNIVLLQVESGFNPNWAFDLATPFRSALFDPGPYTKLLLPTRANIVGGGSWVSEFEALTGIDVRLFGYLGYYAHASVGQYIAGALPDYMRRHGYRTHAFFAVNGDFYGTRQAFGRYGFDAFSDCHDLGIDDWTAKDTEFVTASQKLMWVDQSAPLFSYFVTNGAHAPYKPAPPDRFHTRFRAPAGHLNARLNGYLDRLVENETAVLALRADLEQRYRETGRPFVLVVYGDHQPSPFISNPKLDFTPHRTAAPVTETFMHVMTNIDDLSFTLEGSIPIAMVPTLLSSYVSDGTAPYAPFNYLLHQAFGANHFPNFSFAGALGVLGGIDRLDGAAADAGLGGPARQSQAAALAMIRASGILRADLPGLG